MRSIGLVVVALAACAEPSVRYAEYIATWQQASCERAARCGAYPDMATCLALNPPGEASEHMLAAIDAGFVDFDGDAAERCVDAMAKLTCNEALPEFRNFRCPDITAGRLSDGKACMFGVECLSRECWTESELACDSDGCCRGYCVGDTAPVAAGIGSGCRYQRCVDSRCESSLCVAYLAEGEACNYYGDDFGQETCDVGLACDSSKCVRAASTGEACVPGSCTNYGEFCGTSSGVCEPRRFKGETCLHDGECASNLACDGGTYKCAERPAVATLPLGTKCRALNTEAPCADNTFCDADIFNGVWDGVCALPKAVGERCLAHEHCASGSCSNDLKCAATICL